MITFNNKLQHPVYESLIGLEVEFYTDKSIQEIKADFVELLGKKILDFDKAHSNFEPTDEVFKLEPDFSGGEKLNELVTGPLPYHEARLVLTKVMKWINENGYTDDRSSLHINVSFNDKVVGTNFLSHMNVLKFILDFNENKVYESFPKRESTVYAKSIKYIVPANKYYIENTDNIVPKNFILPDTKYYGINFSKLIENYLEFRYIGGKDYETKTEEILELMDYFIVSLSESIQEKDYSPENKRELQKILREHQNLVNSYRSYKEFTEYFPDVKILADLRTDPNYVGLFYNNIRDEIYKIVSETGLREGYINYDSDSGRIQLKDAKIPACYLLEGVDIINCEVNGLIQNCDIFESKFVNSQLTDCNLFNHCELIGSKLKNSYVNQTSKLDDCYVFGRRGVMNGHMQGGIFREGKITNVSDISPETEIVEFEKIK